MIHRSIYNFLLLNTNNFNRILNIRTKTAATTTIYNNSSNTTAGTIIINTNNNLSENLHCYVKYIICTPIPPFALPVIYTVAAPSPLKLPEKISRDLCDRQQQFKLKQHQSPQQKPETEKRCVFISIMSTSN